MSIVRTSKSFGLAVLGRSFCLTLAALAFTAVSGLTGTAARADNLPFWEQADIDKAASAKKSSSKKASYNKKNGKSYASKNSKKSYASKNTKKLGGYAEATEPVKKKKKGVKVAALGKGYYGDEKPKKSLSGGVSWSASAGCLDSSLKSVIYNVASKFGSLRVNSTCRSKSHNRAVGGAHRSKHLTGDAVDFRVFGNVGAVYAYLRSNGNVGGLKHYGGGLFHIDNGERRSW